MGSPPHARGRRCLYVPFKLLRRITPACAGKTLGDHLPACFLSDHPRMRGEDLFPPLRQTIPNGSPPHARGRRGWSRVWGLSRGITPACAGKTKWLPTTLNSLMDHPRMRGEDALIREVFPEARGSPPHARGRLCDTGLFGLFLGDHPRMRGED